jgi:deoxyuridine 5'-triphosphate nucleotidohydrolase
MTIKVATITDTAKIPTRKHEGDAGADLYYDGPTFLLYPGEINIVRTGVKVKIPEGSMGYVADKGRNNYDILGRIVDYTFQGEILVKLINTTNEKMVIEDGQAIAQLIIWKVLTDEIEQIDESVLFEEESERKTDGGMVRQFNGDMELLEHGIDIYSVEEEEWENQ